MTAYNPFFNNESDYLVGTYRQIQTLILDETIKPVEGLIVDAKSGGLGFRNHTVPANSEHGATWAEDLLFILPETHCENTNLTIEFTVASSKERTATSI